MFKKYLVILMILILYPTPSFAKAPIKWAFTNYPPAHYKTESGEYKGFLHDITMEVFENRLGIPLKISILPWKRCQLLVEKGKYDMLLTIPTPERLKYTMTTQNPVWLKRRIIYTYAGHPRIKEMHTIMGLKAIKKAGYTLVSYLGNGWAESIVEGEGIPIIYANKVDGMYEMLARHRGDILIEEPIIANPRIQELGLGPQIIQSKGVGEESGFHFLIGKKSQYAGLVEQLDLVIAEMIKDGTIKRIMDSY